MLSFTTMERKLQSALSIERYIHTMGVVSIAIKLAEHYGLDADKIKIGALLHDCVKDYPDYMKKRFCKEFHVAVDEVMLENIDLTHAFLGAEVAKREYGVKDEDILNAIRFHTTGRKEMSMVEKIVFIADYIELGRKPFEGLEEARQLAFYNVDETMEFVLKATIENVKERGKPLHPFSVEAFEYYNKRR